MSPGLWQLLLVVVVALLLFGGRGKISSIMGDMAKGIRSFRSGLKDDEEEEDKKSPEPLNVTPEKDKV
ncbi:MAG: Sec-independent protein translocase TatA [Ponticaulis sp.]|nr:Sec-independent protein translocase TatA [Ponticaulis sp.]|tara:strand:+ start:4484 stop:4687 length:204 start_codon:yes stop_codon:yes gene_type:complete